MPPGRYRRPEASGARASQRHRHRLCHRQCAGRKPGRTAAGRRCHTCQGLRHQASLSGHSHARAHSGHPPAARCPALGERAAIAGLGSPCPAADGHRPCSEEAAQQALAQARACALTSSLPRRDVCQRQRGSVFLCIKFARSAYPSSAVSSRYKSMDTGPRHGARCWPQAFPPARSTARQRMRHSSNPKPCGNACASRFAPATACSSCAATARRLKLRPRPSRARAATGWPHACAKRVPGWSCWPSTSDCCRNGRRNSGSWHAMPPPTAACGCSAAPKLLPTTTDAARSKLAAGTGTHHPRPYCRQGRSRRFWPGTAKSSNTG